MTGEDALKEIQKKITDATAEGKTPVKILIPSKYENALITLETNNRLKEIISTEGVQAAFPKINGVKTEWGAEELDLISEEDETK